MKLFQLSRCSPYVCSIQKRKSGKLWISLSRIMLSKNPKLLSLSLEKRIIPRCSVLQLLMSKDLIKRDISLAYALQMTEQMFLRKFVSKYQHMIPEVVGHIKAR
ncbi:unnamed protein product [Ilex paraguariensis]|uniref:HTH araC/xylS-type domain-containing protein n=1 Tax=Ilex paraguariensis TaxID=185542 RepID=A0ABC8TEM9_9AQUA